jgi:hypothetical protein
MGERPRWLEKQNLYIVEEPGCFDDARQLAMTNEQHAFVFFTTAPLDSEQHGVLISPDGTEEHMSYAVAMTRYHA